MKDSSCSTVILPVPVKTRCTWLPEANDLDLCVLWKRCGRMDQSCPHTWGSGLCLVEESKTSNHKCKCQISSVQLLSRVQLFATLCQPGLPVHQQLPESTRTHVYWVSDAIQSSHPLSSPSPPVLNPSQHQGLFKWVSSSHQVAKVLGVSVSTSVLPMNTQDWSALGWTGWISLQSKGLSRVFSNTTVQNHSSSVLSFLYSPTLTSIHDYWKNHSLD